MIPPLPDAVVVAALGNQLTLHNRSWIVLMEMWREAIQQFSTEQLLLDVAMPDSHPNWRVLCWQELRARHEKQS